MRELKRSTLSGLLGTALVILVGLAAGCSSGGGSADFDFSGVWSAVATVTASNVPDNPVGERSTDVVRVTQNGTAVSVMIPGFNPMAGTCDPKAGTFSASGMTVVAGTAVTHSMNGRSESADTMSGELVIAAGPFFTRMTWTAQLTSRSMSIAAAPGGAEGGKLAAMLRRAGEAR